MSFADRQGDKTIVQVVAMGPQADEADAAAREGARNSNIEG